MNNELVLSGLHGMGPVDVRGLHPVRPPERGIVKTHIIDLADLQRLIRGERITVGDVRIVMDLGQLQEALTALTPLALGNPGHAELGVELLREVGIDLDAKR